jgi:pilus assembly protein FimV
MHAVAEGPALDMDFDISAPAPLTSNGEALADAASDQDELDNLPQISLSMDGVSLTDNDSSNALAFDLTSTMPLAASIDAPAQPTNDFGMLEFDLGSLSLDLEPPAAEPALAPQREEDPLETKLALAEEFVSIGDEDGARALIEEVVAESSGDMRAKAQRALANLS